MRFPHGSRTCASESRSHAGDHATNQEVASFSCPQPPDRCPRPSAAPGSALETFVGEDVNTMLIVNLLSGTEYSVKVLASYSAGSSEALSGRAKTRESKC